MSAIKAIRGMNDILPADTPAWRFVEDTARALLEAYGYEEIRPPVVERTELFRRSIGEVTDIVEKEMYTFPDRNGDSLTLRPECTASCVRAAIEHGLLRAGVRRLWATGPMFRHERPQKGRYRQFHQIDVELIGAPEAGADAEVILLSRRLWRRLGVRGLRLEVNTLGGRAAQAGYRERLVAYFSAHRDRLDEDSTRRLETNPLRILDSKNPAMQALVEAAPKLLDGLDDDSRARFERLLAILDDNGVAYRVNARLVRGLDYYTGAVFEWTTDELGAQSAVCGGGRYDGLVEEIGGPATPAIGFAIGLERLVELVRAQGLVPAPRDPDCYLVAVGEAAGRAAHRVAEDLRDALGGTRVAVDAGEGSFRAKIKRADRSGARLALLLGDDEVRDGRVAVKDLRADAEQASVAVGDLAGEIARRLAEPAAPVLATDD